MLSSFLQADYAHNAQAATNYKADLDLDPAIFIGGYYAGISGVGLLDKIIKCYEPNDELTATLIASMYAAIQGDTDTGEAKWKETYPLYVQALSGCGDIGDTISGWFQEISDDIARSDYAQIRDQVYAENKD